MDSQYFYVRLIGELILYSAMPNLNMDFVFSPDRSIESLILTVDEIPKRLAKVATNVTEEIQKYFRYFLFKL